MVAVIDTGALLNHPDIEGNIVDYFDAEGFGLINDINRHDTHVSRVISTLANNEAGVVGASYKAGIVPMYVVSKDNSNQYVMSTASI